MIEDNRLSIYESTNPVQRNFSKEKELDKPVAESQWRISSLEHNSNPFTNLTYFQLLKVMLKENRLFFFHEFMSGNFVKKVFMSFGLGCLCGSNNKADLIESILLKIYEIITPDWLPSCLRPFFCGLFFPMILLFYLDYQYLKSDFIVSGTLMDICQTFMIVMIILFLVLGLRTGGNLNSNVWKYRSASICTQKPWLKIQKLFCAQCKIIKPIRSYHCNYCNLCTPKYTKHSIVLNQCIGSSNQLFYMLYQGLFFILITVILAFLVSPRQSLFTSFKVFIVRFIFFLVNSYLQGMSGFEFLRGLLYTINYNCTEHEVNNWSKKQYICTFDRTRFYNPFESTIPRHISSSLYALVGCSDQQGQNKNFNWSKTHYYNPSHIPNHHQHIQWVLFYQQYDQLQSKRHFILSKQIQLLSKLQNISPSFPNQQQLFQLKNPLEIPKQQKQQPPIQLQQQQYKHEFDLQDSDIHSISDVDVRSKDIGLLHNQKINKSTM